jgi:hypothetical protein
MIILTVYKGNCSDSDTLLIDVIDNVNVETIVEEAIIEIIPNPVLDKFELNLSFEQPQQKVEIVIHNSLGQQVFWQSLEDVHLSTTYTFWQSSGWIVLDKLEKRCFY